MFEFDVLCTSDSFKKRKRWFDARLILNNNTRSIRVFETDDSKQKSLYSSTVDKTKLDEIIKCTGDEISLGHLLITVQGRCTTDCPEVLLNRETSSSTPSQSAHSKLLATDKCARVIKSNTPSKFSTVQSVMSRLDPAKSIPPIVSSCIINTLHLPHNLNDAKRRIILPTSFDKSYSYCSSFADAVSEEIMLNCCKSLESVEKLCLNILKQLKENRSSSSLSKVKKLLPTLLNSSATALQNASLKLCSLAGSDEILRRGLILCCANVEFIISGTSFKTSTVGDVDGFAMSNKFQSKSNKYETFSAKKSISEDSEQQKFYLKFPISLKDIPKGS